MIGEAGDKSGRTGRRVAIGISIAVVAFSVQSLLMKEQQPSYVKELRAGYESVRNDWPAFIDSWGASGNSADMVQSNRITMQYLQETELIQFLRLRAAAMEQFAEDPQVQMFCAGDKNGLKASGSREDAETLLSRMPGVMKYAGIAHARRNSGQIPWTPSFDLATDEELWFNFGTALKQFQATKAIDVLVAPLEGRTLNARDTCLGLAELYRVTTLAPDYLIGNVRMIDVIRGIDLYGTEVK
jgi:hypothetical protein